MSASTPLTDATHHLARISALIDPALAHLEVEALEDELLRRVCGILGIEGAAILLIDTDAHELVVTATHGGGEHHWRVGDRQRLGPRTRSMVPLVVSGRTVGFLALGAGAGAAEPGPEDRQIARVAADRLALATDARRANIERAAAAALQRSLLPDRLPIVPGMEVAARYLPGDEGGMGGDWYDLFALPGGRFGLVIGDVAGRGLEAAVVMGRLRSALRAYAIEASDPAEVLERLDRKAQHFEAGQMTTVLYAVIDASGATLQASSAGHLPAALAAPGRAPVRVETVVDPPIGVMRAVTRRQSALELPPGAVLCLFTDGLVERRGVPLDESIDRLLAHMAPIAPDALCDDLLEALVDEEEPVDDVAVLAIRRTPSASVDDHGA